MLCIRSQLAMNYGTVKENIRFEKFEILQNQNQNQNQNQTVRCVFAVDQRTLDAVGEQLIWASITIISLVRDLQKHWPNDAEAPLLEPDSISSQLP